MFYLAYPLVKTITQARWAKKVNKPCHNDWEGSKASCHLSYIIPPKVQDMVIMWAGGPREGGSAVNPA